jgi:hypothetical protein
LNLSDGAVGAVGRVQRVGDPGVRLLEDDRPPGAGELDRVDPRPSVIAFVRSSEALSGTVTQLVLPSNESAVPKRPMAAHVVLVAVPWLPVPDASVTAVPVPSLKAYAATGPGAAARAGGATSIKVSTTHSGMQPPRTDRSMDAPCPVDGLLGAGRMPGQRMLSNPN